MAIHVSEPLASADILAVICSLLRQDRLSPAQELVLLEVWLGRTYLEIAERHGYEPNYLKDVGSRLWQLLSHSLGQRVSKKNFRSLLEQHLQRAPGLSRNDVDDGSGFYGRDLEVETLSRWLTRERCRLVALFGMGGIGKTALAAKMTVLTQPAFEAMAWQSLRNAPLLDDVLVHLLGLFSVKMQPMHKPRHNLDLLMQHLRSHRCLLVLDNVETLLRGGDMSGQFRQGYENYAELLVRIAEEAHQSCLILTSREKPRVLASFEAAALPIRSLKLAGLRAQEVVRIFTARGRFFGTAAEWQLLLAHYDGNPLALRIVASTILELFDGNLGPFLRQGIVVFGDIDTLLAQQFERLSDLERTVMDWLALHREPRSARQLHSDVLSPPDVRTLFEALQVLSQRSLIESAAAGSTQQPVVMEYVSERLIEAVYQEIVTGELRYLREYSLIQTQAEDYVRESQIRTILEPLVARLKTTFRAREPLAEHLRALLARLQTEPLPGGDYAAGNLVNLLCQLKLDLSGWSFAHLAVWRAYLKNVPLQRVDFSGADLAGSVFTQTLGSILSLAYSPDGQFLLTGDTSCDVRLWRADGLEYQHTFRGHTSWVNAVAFSADGCTLASGSFDQTVRLWDVNSGACLATLYGHCGWIRSVAFSPQNGSAAAMDANYSPTGATLASGSADGTVRLWNGERGYCIAVLEGHTESVRSIAFTPDGTILATGSDDGTVRLWGMADGQCIATLPNAVGSVCCLLISPDGERLLAGGGDGAVRIWEIETGRYLGKLQGHSAEVLSIAISPDNHTLATGSEDGSVRLWEMRSGRCLTVLQGHASRVWSVAFSPDNRTLATSSDDQTLKVWAARTGRCLQTLQGYTNFVWSVACAPQNGSAGPPDRRVLATGSEDGAVRLWDASSGLCDKILAGHRKEVLSVAFSPDGAVLASGGPDQAIKLWDVHSGICLATLQGHRGWVRSVVFSPHTPAPQGQESGKPHNLHGLLLASTATDGSVRVWDVGSGHCLVTLQTEGSQVFSAAFAPDGTSLAGGSQDGTIALWDMRLGRLARTWQGHTGRVQAVVFSPDGRLLATGSHDRSVRLWDRATGGIIFTLNSESRVWSVAFSPDGAFLATGSEDRTIRLWDVVNGCCLAVWHGHTRWVWSLAFSPDGAFLASGSQDETVRLWEVHTGKCLRTLRAGRLYEGMKIAGVTGLSEAQKDTLRALGALDQRPDSLHP